MKRILSVAIVALAISATPTTAEVIMVGEVQGSSHRSPMDGEGVVVMGVVTLIANNGFYLQGPADGDELTSDGVFIFTQQRPYVAVGDQVRVDGTVVEFRTSQGDLTLTEIANADVEVLQSGQGLPSPLLLGSGGRTIPSETIDDDNFGTFDPALDAVDFFETLEGMRVAVEDGIVLAPPNRHGEVWILSNFGDDATNFDGRAVVMAEGDQNPERVLVDLRAFGEQLDVQIGDRLGTVIGVLENKFGKYRVIASDVFTDGGPAIPPAVRTDAVSIAIYNVENLDPVIEDQSGSQDDDVGSGKFEAIAGQLVRHLGSPSIIALQEVQDNDGAENSSIVSADDTLSLLSDMIMDAGGPRYDFLDVPPVDDRDGGQPGGNIRVAYLYDPARVTPIAGGARRIVDPAATGNDDGAFEHTRKPLLAAFETDAGPVTLINVHLSSRGGSDPAFGAIQPPRAAAGDKRLAQSQVIGEVVADVLAANADAKLVVLGDFNAFYFEPELTTLEADYGLTNLWRTLPASARRSYIFDGQGQALDHALVSSALVGATRLQAFSINSGRLDPASDHDPLLVTIPIEATPEAFSTTLAIAEVPALPGVPPASVGLGLPTPPHGLEGADLRAWLRANWYAGRHRDLGYRQARVEMYSFVDVAEDGRVYCVYSGFSQEAEEVSHLNPINAEHTQPQSTFSKRSPMRSDILHLFPTHESPNQSRGHDPFGEIDDATTDTWFGVDASGRLSQSTSPPASDLALFSEDNEAEFEPPDAHKGNTARALFYFHTMYEGTAGSIDKMSADGAQRLTEWHETDPPDTWERQRNDRVELVQGNRNPFVDLPDLVCRAFPEAC